MSELYRKTGITEMEPYDPSYHNALRMTLVSMSQADRENGSPKLGDMIAHNPKNPRDEWLVAEKYFKDNYKVNTRQSPKAMIAEGLEALKGNGGLIHLADKVNKRLREIESHHTIQPYIFYALLEVCKQDKPKGGSDE